MLRIAILQNNIIVNIAVYDKMPEGKNFFDVTNLDARIGDTVKGGKVISNWNPPVSSKFPLVK